MNKFMDEKVLRKTLEEIHPQERRCHASDAPNGNTFLEDIYWSAQEWWPLVVAARRQDAGN